MAWSTFFSQNFSELALVMKEKIKKYFQNQQPWEFDITAKV